MRKCILWMLLGVIVLMGACSDEPAGPVAPNPSLAQAIVDSANDSLGSVMRTALDSILEYGDSTFRPSDLDFTGVNTMYERAVAADPENLDAHFGAGFTELLAVFADPELNALYERVKRFADTLFLQDGGYFPVAIYPAPAGLIGPDLLPRGFPLTAGGTQSLLPDLPRLDHALRASAAADPQPSDIQAILELELLPRVLDARDHIAVVAQNRNYTFWITPGMQGNPGADSVELDMTEVRIAMGALYGLEAAIDVATARNLDVSEYTVAGLNEAFNTGSDFLTLKTDGQDRMQSAKTALLATQAQVDSALSFLLTESDVNQDDDLIQYHEWDVDYILALRDTLRSVKTYLTQVREIKIPYDWLNWYSPDTLTTTVDLAKFFDDPVDDPKALLPAYTVTFDVDTAYRQIAALHFSDEKYWDSLQSRFGVAYPNDTAVYPYHLPDVKNREYYRVLSLCQAVWGWDDLTEWSTGDECYYYYSNNQNWFYSQWYDGSLIVCMGWEANSFAEWNFPDATLHGVFPNLTNAELKDFLFPEGGVDWIKSLDCVDLGI